VLTQVICHDAVTCTASLSSAALLSQRSSCLAAFVVGAYAEHRCSTQHSLAKESALLCLAPLLMFTPCSCCLHFILSLAGSCLCHASCPAASATAQAARAASGTPAPPATAQVCRCTYGHLAPAWCSRFSHAAETAAAAATQAYQVSAGLKTMAVIPWQQFCYAWASSRDALQQLIAVGTGWAYT
jgi:hypothetical protein